MAFSLKKWVTGMLESTRLNDTNTNWTDIESAIDTLQTNAGLLPIRKSLQNESVLGYAETLSPGAYLVSTTADTIDLPSANYRFMPGLILVRTTNGIVVVLFNYTNGQIATNVKTTSGWLSDWNIIG
jgi:hypothetical protein